MLFCREVEVSMKRALLGFLVVAAFGCACAFGQGTTTTETVTITQDFVFPPVGLATSETAAVNLANIAPVPATTTTTPVTAPSCTGTVTFANAAGGIIPAGSKPIPFAVGSGDIATVPLPTGLVFTGPPLRALLLASVQQTITRPSAAPCSLVFSLEVFDVTSGVTHVFLGNASATTPPVTPILPILEQML